MQRVAALDGSVLVSVSAASAGPHAPMAAARGVMPTRSMNRAPASYTPKHLADRILRSRSVLEGERKQVTVLFADVKGSMELAGQVDA